MLSVCSANAAAEYKIQAQNKLLFNGYRGYSSGAAVTNMWSENSTPLHALLFRSDNRRNYVDIGVDGTAI